MKDPAWASPIKVNNLTAILSDENGEMLINPYKLSMTRQTNFRDPI